MDIKAEMRILRLRREDNPGLLTREEQLILALYERVLELETLVNEMRMHY